MQTRVAVISMILEAGSDVAGVNALLHEFAPYILGRMGIPYRRRAINIISVAMEAPQDAVNTLTGKLGRLTPRREREDHVLRQHLRKRSLNLTPPLPDA